MVVQNRRPDTELKLILLKLYNKNVSTEPSSKLPAIEAISVGSRNWGKYVMEYVSLMTSRPNLPLKFGSKTASFKLVQIANTWFQLVWKCNNRIIIRTGTIPHTLKKFLISLSNWDLNSLFINYLQLLFCPVSNQQFFVSKILNKQ